MYGFNILVLLYLDNGKYINWIIHFLNYLYTNNDSIYIKYLKNYKKEKLEELKIECESKYNFKLNNFNDNCLEYSNSNIIFFQNNNPYIRHVKIYSKANNKFLCMTEKGKIIGKYEDYEDSLWDITISLKNKTITFFSNGYYLQENNGNVIGNENMKEWNYEIIEETAYCFFCQKLNNINYLSIEGPEIKLNKSKPEKNENFQLIDFPEEFNDDNPLDISFYSSLTSNIEDFQSSIYISENNDSLLNSSDSNYS
jgi:hypothetical protein